MAWTRTNLGLQLNDVHFLSRHIMSLSSHDHHSYLVIPLLQSIKVLEKRFFSWPLSLLLLFYGEFSEWAYAFSWIKLFQLVFYFNVAMHFSVSYFGNFSISVKKKYILYEILSWNVSFHSWYQKMEQHYLLSFRPKVAACAWSLIFSLLDVAKLVGHSSSQ